MKKIDSLKEPLFTLGITAHDSMPFDRFKNSLDSVLNSYRYMKPKKPINVIISRDISTEKDFIKQFEEKCFDELEEIKKQNNNISEFEIKKRTKGTKEYKEYRKEKIEEFKKNQELKKEYIKEFEEKASKEGLYVDHIENTQKYGKVSASRNRIIDICPTQFLTFLDGDDPIYPNVLLKYQEECENLVSQNPEKRKKYEDENEMVENPDVIYFEKGNSKTPCYILYNIPKLKEKNIRFTKQVGCEDGFFKANILQKGLVRAWAKKVTDISEIVDYEASNSTIRDEKKKYEEILQLVNHLARHNKNGMFLWREYEKNDKIPLDYNNIFQYFSTNYNYNGYGFLFFSSEEDENKISTKDTNNYVEDMAETITYIISSLILYPGVLENEKERDYFETVKKSIESVVQNNYVDDVLDIFKNTQGYDDIFNKIRSNFDSNEEFDRCLSEFNYHFNRGIGIFKEALKKGVNKNPHLTGDTSNTATILNFNRYFSVKNLKRKTKNEQIILMNKILKGKFLPREFLNMNTFKKKSLLNNMEKRKEYIIKYLFDNTKNEDKFYIFDLIKETNSYKKISSRNKDQKSTTRKIVDKVFKNPLKIPKQKQEISVENYISIFNDGKKSKIDKFLKNQKSSVINKIFSYACEKGEKQVIEMLFNDENARNKIINYTTTRNKVNIDNLLLNFNLACKNGKIDIIKMFFKYPDIKLRIINYNIQTIHSNESFYIACENGQSEVVSLLFENELINKEDVMEHFEYACENGKIETVKVLLNNKNTKGFITVDFLKSIFDLAYKDCDLEQFKTFIESPDIRKIILENKEIFLKPFFEKIKNDLEKGLNFLKIIIGNQEILENAIESSYIKEDDIKLYLKSSLDVELLKMLFKNQTVKNHIEKFKNVETQDGKSINLLHNIAIAGYRLSKKNKKEMINFLIKNNFDFGTNKISISSKYFINHFMYIISEILKDYEINLETKIKDKSIKEILDDLEKSLKNGDGIDPNEYLNPLVENIREKANEKGFELFIETIKSGDLEKVQEIFMLENIDINKKTKDGLSLIDFAVECGKQDIVLYLMDKKLQNIEYSFEKQKNNTNNCQAQKNKDKFERLKQDFLNSKEEYEKQKSLEIFSKIIGIKNSLNDLIEEQTIAK